MASTLSLMRRNGYLEEFYIYSILLYIFNQGQDRLTKEETDIA